MNILTPPTDNIYKFAGIAGLAFFLYMGYYFFTPNANDEKQWKLTEESKNLDARIYVFLQEIKYNPDIKKDTLEINIFESRNAIDIGTPKFAKFVYSLPKSYQSIYQNIFVKRMELAAKQKVLNDKTEYTSFLNIFYLIFFYSVEILCVWGIIRWYFESKEEKIHESRLRRKEIFAADDCQSCYKEFIFEDERGTNSDGSVSNYFCKECYSSGQYTEPELTFDEAQARLKSKLEKLTYKPRRVRKALASFKHLSRWERESSW